MKGVRENMKLTWREKLVYGIGAVGKDMVYMLTASYILYYYQDIVGVSAVFTGFLLMAARVFDALKDPLMGILVAKTKTRFGKFRPWIFSGTVVNALVLYAMFAVPNGLEGAGLLIYVSAAYIIWGVTYTMMDIPFWSMIPAFTQNGKEREGLTTLGRTCASAGSALVTVVTVPVVYALGSGNEREGFKWFALIVATFFILTAILLCLTIKEKSTADMQVNSVKDMFKALIRNDQAMAVVIFIVLINCSIYLTSNLVIYFFKYDFGGEDWRSAMTLFNTFGGAMQILAMMVLYPLLRKFLSTTQVFLTGLGMAVVGYIVLLAFASLLGLSNVFLLFIPGFFIFAANGILTILTTVFLANSVDYGELKNGVRDESVIFSMQTFVVKLASGVSVLMASLCLAIFQISENTEAEAAITQQSIMGLRLTMTVLPIIGLTAAGILFLKKFKLTDQRVQEISDELKARGAKEEKAE